jgi:hypothetical protein
MKGSESTTGLRDRLESTAGEAWQRTDHMVREHPASSALVMFSAGCFLGLMTAWLLMPTRRERHRYQFDRPEWLSGSRFSKAIERVPETVGHYLGRR